VRSNFKDLRIKKLEERVGDAIIDAFVENAEG
jgi:hypothetical protein